MADKDEKKAEDNEKDESPKDPNTKLSKRNKILLIAGIGGVLLLAIAIGGFIFFKTMSANKHVELEATQEEGHKETEKTTKETSKNKEEHGKKEDKSNDKNADKKSADKKEENSKSGENSKKEENKGTANFGDTFSLPKMDLNLGNPLENRYIRIAVAIEYRGGDEQLSELKKREIQVKDIIISTVTSKTKSQLLTENGKELLRREILNKINEVADKPIQNIFFTDFLVE